MQVTINLDNISIFFLTEKIMAGMVYDWWIGPPELEWQAVVVAGLSTLKVLIKKQFVPEPIDEKNQIITDLESFGQDFMAKVYKENISNDLVQKNLFLSKMAGNLGDLIFKDIEVQNKIVDQIYWVDLLFRCHEKVKYLH